MANPKYPKALGMRVAQLLLIVLAVCSSPVSSYAGLAGHWEGAFVRLGAVQHVAFDFELTESGWIGTYDIPEMILYREPIRELAVAGDTLKVRVFWGRFTCLINDAIGEITGDNPKWGPPVALHLKKSLPTGRPSIEHVRFQSGSLTLAGDLLIPPGNPPFPAVIVIEGGTAEGRSLWTYRSFGDLLARNGIAALVYDKRGVGESDGDFDLATFDELAIDAGNAVEYLKEREDIDPASIGLLGISQGGWIAPLVAVNSPEVAFVEMLAGPAVSIWQQELHRVEYSMRAGSLGENDPDVFTDAEIQAALTHAQLGFDVAQDPNRWSEWETSVEKARQSSWAAYVTMDTTLAELQGWLRYRYDPAETLRRLKIPALAMFGGIDPLVPPEENVAPMTDLLSEANNAQVVVFPEVAHDFLTGATLIGDEWKWPSGFWRWNRRAPGLADSIVTWTWRQVRR